MAIALTPVWNHLTERIIEPGAEIEMPEEMVQSLIDIGAAKETAPEQKPRKNKAVAIAPTGESNEP